MIPRFLGQEGRHLPYDQSRLVVLPVPYEGTVSYGHGAALGPQAILDASEQLEMYDEELDACPDQQGIFTLPALSARETPEAMMADIYQAVLPHVQKDKLVFLLGGEHSVSYGAFRALLEARGGKPFSVLQIDAHADLRANYQGSPHSHASIMARAVDLGLSLVQVGIRAVCQEERDFMRSKGLEANVFWGHQLAALPLDEWVGQVVQRLGPEVYISLDIDGLDPSIVPATGTPVPGGLGWYPTLSLLRAVCQARRIVGLDLVELAPQPPHSQASEFLAARLAYKMMGYALA